MQSKMMALQSALAGLGYPVGTVDGIWGARTRQALADLLAANGRQGGASPLQPVTDLPWMAEARRVLGRHEGRDNGFLQKWLKSDGKTLGDPAKLPWCGDFVETCIRIALPSEPFPGDLGENPYWARNWSQFGRATQPTYGAVLVFGRDGGGHVGFCVGEEGGSYAVLGGNQSNAVTIANIAKSRLIAARWPATFAAQPIYLPQTRGGKLSTNEA